MRLLTAHTIDQGLVLICASGCMALAFAHDRPHYSYPLLFALQIVAAVLVVRYKLTHNDLYILVLAILMIVAFMYVMIVRATASLNVQCGLPLGSISEIGGVLIADSSISASGNQVLRLQLGWCKDARRTMTVARGVVMAITKEHRSITSGSSVCLKGIFDAGNRQHFFYADSLAVEMYCQPKRLELLQALCRRFNTLSPTGEQLSVLLLLGVSIDYCSPIRTMAIESGSAHVLALSGMHLHVIAHLCEVMLRPFFSRRCASFIVLPVLSIFVWIAGPKPSLVRALIMHALMVCFPDSINARRALALTFLIHIIFWPQTAHDSSFLLSYAALAGLLCAYNPIKMLLQVIVHPLIASWMATTIAVQLFSAPLVMHTFGVWYPIGIIVAPILAFLASIMMCCALMYLVLPVFPLRYCLNIIGYIFERIISWASSWSHGHPMFGNRMTLFVAGAVVLTVLVLLGYACKRMKSRSKHIHDLGLFLRFSQCNH